MRGLDAGISHPPRMILTVRFWRSWCRSVWFPLERLWRRDLKKKPTARFASGGGFETFGIFLGSSLAVGGNRLRRSRNNRRRRGSHALSGERKIHTGDKGSTANGIGK